jgi:outer membrane receptor protein involved in Fe transport
VAIRSPVFRRASAALLWAWVSVLAAAAEPSSLGDVIEALRATGVQVLYSSDLVAPDMKAAPAAPGEDALTHARQALQAHGLTLQPLGANAFVVVRARSDPQARAATPPAAAAVAVPQPVTEVSVYASRYALGAGSIGEPSFLTSTAIEQVPGSQNDALRATRVLPGMASNGSSRPYIRGSRLDDVQVQFDGVPLADPFHLKDFQNLISAFDADAVERIEVYSGGFPVRYGTRSGGVIDITPRTVSSGYENSLGASLIAYNASSVGRSESLPVDWLATARLSNQDSLLKPFNGEEGEPQFMDTLGRVRWRVSDTAALTAGWLLLDDRIALADDGNDEAAAANYRDEYGWLAYDQSFGKRLQSRTVLSVSHAERDRAGDLNIRDVANGHVNETRDSRSFALRSDWTFRPGPRLTWSYGLEAMQASASLQYDRAALFSAAAATAFARSMDDTLSASAEPKAASYALYGALRRRWSDIEAELGVRLDMQDYEHFSSRGQVSPRFNIRYDVNARWRIYGSWGRFSQAQRVDEWRTEDAQRSPDEAELATHMIAGVAYAPADTMRVALEVYRKRWSNVSPYFDNSLDSLSLVPDLAPDRVRVTPSDSESAGAELSMRRALSPTLEVWGSYAWSRVADEFAGEDVLRHWDQPHALSLGLSWHSGAYSAATLLGWHRGWPRTPFARSVGPAQPAGTLTLGARNSDRWDNYFSVDLRGGWSVPTRYGELATWIEVTNVADRQNECCVRLEPPDVPMVADSWLPRIVNIGFSWRFRGAH